MNDMTDKEMQFLKRLAMAIDAKVCSEIGGEKRYSNIAIKNEYLPLVQRMIYYYISDWEKSRKE